MELIENMEVQKLTVAVENLLELLLLFSFVTYFSPQATSGPNPVSKHNNIDDYWLRKELY